MVAKIVTVSTQPEVLCFTYKRALNHCAPVGRVVYPHDNSISAYLKEFLVDSCNTQTSWVNVYWSSSPYANNSNNAWNINFNNGNDNLNNGNDNLNNKSNNHYVRLVRSGE